MFLGPFFSKRLRAEIDAALGARTSVGASPPSAACGGTAPTSAHGMPTRAAAVAIDDQRQVHAGEVSARGLAGGSPSGPREGVPVVLVG